MNRTALVLFISCIACLAGNSQTLQQKLESVKDSATIAASKQYADPSLFKRLFLGKNYRNVWAQPVRLPVFHLKQLGFTIDKLGGGQQTKSLRLRDPEGREWALRTIDKDVEGALPKWLQNTIAEKVTQDMVSAAHPYAPLTITDMAKAVDVTVAKAYFFVVPDDPDFGEHRALFANTLCMLEDRNPTPDKTETENTENVVEDLLEKNNYKIAAEEVLRARLLDMLIADWDRHQDQWRWGKRDSAGLDYYYAIPRDRDQAYFYSNGLLVKVAQLISLKHLVGFTNSTRRLKSLNAKSWNFDRVFLAELSRADWERITKQFQTLLTDAVIKAAIKELPPEVYALSGATLETKLIDRRNGMLKDALRYYEFLADEVMVIGSDDAERFSITGDRNALVLSSYTKKGNKLLYQRTFDPDDTKIINLIGLGGDDDFVVSEGDHARIKLIIDGGKGNNSINLKGKIRNKIVHSDLDAKAFEDEIKAMLKIKKDE